MKAESRQIPQKLATRLKFAYCLRSVERIPATTVFRKCWQCWNKNWMLNSVIKKRKTYYETFWCSPDRTVQIFWKPRNVKLPFCFYFAKTSHHNLNVFQWQLHFFFHSQGSHVATHLKQTLIQFAYFFCILEWQFQNGSWFKVKKNIATHQNIERLSFELQNFFVQKSNFFCNSLFHASFANPKPVMKQGLIGQFDVLENLMESKVCNPF